MTLFLDLLVANFSLLFFLALAVIAFVWKPEEAKLAIKWLCGILTEPDANGGKASASRVIGLYAAWNIIQQSWVKDSINDMLWDVFMISLGYAFVSKALSTVSPAIIDFAKGLRREALGETVSTKATWIARIAAVLALGLVVWLLWPSDTVQPITGVNIDVKRDKPVVRDDTPTSTLPDKTIRGRVEVDVEIPITKDDKPGDVKHVKVLVDVPKEDTPPVASIDPRSDSAKVTVSYKDYRDPIFNFKLNVLAGVSWEPIGFSPFGGVSFLTVAERFRLAVAVDRFAIGPSIHWEFFREFNVGVKYSLVKFDRDATDVIANISYRF